MIETLTYKVVQALRQFDEPKVLHVIAAKAKLDAEGTGKRLSELVKKKLAVKTEIAGKPHSSKWHITDKQYEDFISSRSLGKRARSKSMLRLNPDISAALSKAKLLKEIYEGTTKYAGSKIVKQMIADYHNTIVGYQPKE